MRVQDIRPHCGFELQKIVYFVWICFLFIVPCLWWPQDLYLLGGDDIKYEYVYPNLKVDLILGSFFTHLVPNESVLVHEISGFLFYLVLTVIKFIFPFINLQTLVNTMVLAGSFVSFFWLTGILSHRNPSSRTHFAIRFLAANIYALSSFQIATLWITQLPVYVYIFTIPLIFGLLVKSAASFSWWHTVLAALIFAISPSPYGCIPWTLPIALCSLPIVISLFFRNFFGTLTTLTLFGLTSLVLALPALIAMGTFAAYSPGTFATSQVADSVRLFIEVNSQNSIITNLALLPTDLVARGLPVLREYPKTSDFLLVVVASITTVIILMAIFLRIRSVLKPSSVGLEKTTNQPKMIFCGILLAWAMCVFFYTGGGSIDSVEMIGAWMKNISWLIMFRNNYDKFSIAISLFSALIIYQSLWIILTWQNSKHKPS